VTAKWRVYRDKGGALWIDPGDQRLNSVDSRTVQALRDSYGTASRDDVEKALGPLAELTAPGEDPLPRGLGRWPLLRLADGKSEAESADLAVLVASRARDADDCRELLAACGLLGRPRGGSR
jgi:hypothetical protein